jgi:hypothetical protein
VAPKNESFGVLRESPSVGTIVFQVTRDTRRFVESRLQDLSALWNGGARLAREEIAKQVRKITLKPIFRTYVATGIWDWLGVMGSAAVMVVPGAWFAPRMPQILASR